MREEEPRRDGPVETLVRTASTISTALSLPLPTVRRDGHHRFVYILSFELLDGQSLRRDRAAIRLEALQRCLYLITVHVEGLFQTNILLVWKAEVAVANDVERHCQPRRVPL